MLNEEKSRFAGKTKLIISFLLGLLTLAFIYDPSGLINKRMETTEVKATQQPVPPANNNITDNFIIGSLQSGVDYDFSELDPLGLNLWHIYTNQGRSGSRNAPAGWTHWAINDSLDKDISLYSSDVQGVLSNLSTHNMKAFLQRPKIEWLCFGQRSDYECEPANYVNSDLFFYTFQQHETGMPVPDSGGNSMFCRVQNSTNNGPTWHNPGFVVKRLKCNTEQSKPSGSGNQWQGDEESDWLIKPRIRIDSNVAHNNQNMNVCKIIVINQRQDTIKNLTIKAGNFLKEINGQFYYNGQYLDEYFFGINDSNLTIHGNWGNLWEWRSRGDWNFPSPAPSPDSLNDEYYRSKVDLQVYWYGNCDMWIDRVRVDNDVAHNLFGTGQTHDLYNQWIDQEATVIAGHNSSPLKFYVELTEFNNIPCISYVNERLQSLGRVVDMVTDVTYFYALHVNWDNGPEVFNAGHIKRNYIDKINAKQILMESYPLTSTYFQNPGMSNTYSRIPNTLSTNSGNNILAGAVSPTVYDEWLQDNLDHNPYMLEQGSTAGIVNNEDGPTLCNYSATFPPQDIGNFRYIMKTGREISRQADIPFIYMQQAHHWFTPGEVRREPTNEEMKLLTNLSVSYGAKGIIYYWYANHTNNVDCDYSYGLTEGGLNFEPRQTNVYGQPKWDSLKRDIQRLKTWDPYLMSFDNTQTKSYIYRLEDERYSCIQNTYFRDIVSYIRGTGEPPCSEDKPDTVDAPNPTGLRYECNEYRYLQVATFKKSLDDPDNYFMIVNRRCSPLQSNNNDGERYIRIIFDQNHNDFAGYNNWNIIDIENPRVIAGTFNKTACNPYVDLKWFNPGQGKLYKIVPVLPSGGTLVADEVISGESFTCEAPVYNNGHNITIGANTTIHFNDSSKFIMDGGVFTVGDQNTSAPQNITSDAVPGGSWRGHSFTNCEVKIYGATFTGLANDTTYAVNIIDCPVVDIRNCTFNTNSSLKGGINTVFFSNPNNETSLSNIYIGANTFNSSGSTIPTVNVSSYAGVTTPLIVENNTFTEGNTAVFLSGVIGGAIKGNTITDNYIGINALTSSIDVVQNTISSTVNGSMGLFAAGGSELKLNSSGAFTLGGLNSISNEGTGTNNINVDGSYFLLDDGENIFNISSDQSSYHLYGYFPMFTAVTTEETNNCFKVNSSPVDPPINMVTSGYQGLQITFNFNPYLAGCEIPDGGDGLAINLGNGIYDTIYTGGSGSGGGENNRLPLNKGEYPQGEGVLYTTPTAKTKYDSVCVLMRYRNYTQAKTKCLDLINTYPDSIQSLFTVSKLFLATVASDTSYNAANNLKIFYENLILNHQSNTSLVKRANYYILKCKVRMREYSQALAGFQQIINQNPYSYEGLIARWDYMATSLLAPQGGSFGSELTVSVRDDNSAMSIDIVNALQKEAEDDDKKPFTKEQRQDIRKSINTAIDISKNNDETKMKTLEEKSELGDVNASKELTQMKSLKQVVKTEKPKSITQHIKIVSEDIRKVFGSNTSGKGNQPKNLPTVFRISQNYPNPFNPVTKINYDLPKDSKVNIVIYDILGREVKRLVNNELKPAGSYIVDFNASNYASGVYFYRIEAEEPNGNKFVDSKKMVLLK